MTTGVLINKVIDFDQSLSLKGMICPTFQNDGTATAFLDGRKIAPGESYSVFAPGIILQNEVAISFEPDSNKSKVLFVAHVRTVDPTV